jgi:hypothetical protein
MRYMLSASVLLSLGTLLVASGCAQDDQPTYAPPATANTPLPFKADADHLTVWNGTRHVPLFVKGVNLGVAVPGTFAGELAATRAQYDHWFDQIGRLGFNAIRTYTLHYPRFYEAVLAYNQTHPQAPIYVLHGIWLDEENPSQDLFEMTDMFEAGIREVVDCAHGQCNIAERRGRAFGRYVADISPYVLGWVIGREVSPDEVAASNRAHPDVDHHDGSAVRISAVNPTEAWFTARLDTLVRYERDGYHVDRPVSVSSWPTLDPLHHPSESLHSTEDLESVDLENIDTQDAPGGYFASYHAYSYYPDFMTHDQAYLDTEDGEGLNSYYAYLLDLKHHYAKHPLLIAEFGVPTSWGNAHRGAAGMSHGGENEREQGQFAGRQLRNIFEAECAGGAFFAWIDEWWKRTWIVDELAFPRQNYAIWHNVTSPEQNFGLIGFDLPAPGWKRWPKLQGKAAIKTVEADVDAEYFQLRLTLAHALTSEETLTLGFDTYADDLGESVLPNGTHTERRNELALVLHGQNEATLQVTKPYDLFGIWHKTSSDAQLYHSVASDAGDWVQVRWQNNAYPTDDGSDVEIDEVGEIVIARSPSQADNRTGVIFDGASVHIRLPWTLLQFTDPSTRTVMHDDRATTSRETRVSEGIALSVQLGDELLETQRFRWEPWTTAPQTSERVKASAAIFSHAVRELPGLMP